jgi:hypothetical protein
MGAVQLRELLNVLGTDLIRFVARYETALAGLSQGDIHQP